MNIQTIEPALSYLQATLSDYEVIPANFGWHIHKAQTYYGLLEYREIGGWQGKAFNQLPLAVQEELKKFN